jgi:hypothetical protein
MPKKLQPFAKAIAPFALSLVAAGLQWASTGTYDGAELETNVTGILTALAVYFVPNRKA